MNPEFEEVYMDDVNGGILPAEKVKEARRLEMDYLKEKHGVYVPRPRAECFEETGEAPDSSQMVGHQQGRSNKSEL